MLKYSYLNTKEVITIRLSNQKLKRLKHLTKHPRNKQLIHDKETKKSIHRDEAQMEKSGKEIRKERPKEDRTQLWYITHIAIWAMIIFTILGTCIVALEAF